MIKKYNNLIQEGVLEDNYFDSVDEEYILDEDIDFHLHHFRTSVSRIYEDSGIADIYLNDLELEELIEQLEEKIKKDISESQIVKMSKNDLNKFRIFENARKQTVYGVLNTSDPITIKTGENFIEIPVDLSIEKGYNFFAISKSDKDLFVKYDDIIDGDMCISIFNYGEEYIIDNDERIASLILVKDRI